MSHVLSFYASGGTVPDVSNILYHLQDSGVSKVGLAALLYKTTSGMEQCSPCFSSIFAQPCLTVNFKRMTWPVRSSINDSSFSPSTSNGTNGRTRIIRVIQEFQTKLSSKIQEVKKNLPMKLLFFLVGFYCATAFSTVIGQTGDWDILSAGLAVVIVEAIGALMYRASLPLGTFKDIDTFKFNNFKFYNTPPLSLVQLREITSLCNISLLQSLIPMLHTSNIGIGSFLVESLVFIQPGHSDKLEHKEGLHLC
ncbi:hypothetical protein SESBI_19431 [Sesbania bispinosa]|nr:hypothetical protein SESBI_19431 [Sesbania bispinosa]